MRRKKEHASVFVMCATILGQAVVPLVGGKGHCTGRSTTSHKLWRYGTTRLCRTGWRSPLLTGGASLVRIFFATQGTLGGNDPNFREPCSRELRRTPVLRTTVNKGKNKGPRIEVIEGI